MAAMDGLAAILLGDFTGVDEVHASAWSDAETVPVEMAAVSELGGALVIMRVKESRRVGAFEAVNVFMSDPESDDVLLYGFDDFGYPPDPPARGRIDKHRIALHRVTARGESRTTFESTSSGFRWGKQFRPAPDAPWQPVVTGEVHRSLA